MEKTPDGYIILSDLVPNWNKGLKDGKVIPMDGCGRSYQGYWLKDVKGENYFLKTFNRKGIPFRFYSELVLEQLAQIIGIPTVESKIVEINKMNIYGLISKDYRKVGCNVLSGKNLVLDFIDYLEETKQLKDYFGVSGFEDLYNYGVNINTMDIIWKSIEYRYRNHSNKNILIRTIFEQLIHRYIFLFLTMQSDFHLGNWEILEFKDGSIAFLTPMYDMDMSFRDDFFDLEKNTTIRTTSNPIKNIYEDFENFYYSSSEEIKNSIHRQYSLLEPEVLQKTLNDINENLSLNFPDNIKNKIMENYVKHYKMIGNILKNTRTR